MGRRALTRTDSPRWTLTGQKRSLEEPRVPPLKICVTTTLNIASQCMVFPHRQHLVFFWGHLETNYMNYRPVLFIFDVISTFLMLLFFTFETKMQLIQCVPCLALFLGNVDPIWGKSDNNSFHFRKRGSRVMSLKCLKRRKVMESRVSTLPRNDKGFQHKPKPNLSFWLRTEIVFLNLVKQNLGISWNLFPF